MLRVLKNNSTVIFILIIFFIGVLYIFTQTKNDTPLVPVSEREQQLSNTVEMFDSNGEEIPVYEMPTEIYNNTDFREPN